MLSVVNHFAVTINRPPRHNIIDSLKTPQKTFGESSTLSVPMAAVQRGNAPADTTYTKIFVGGLAWETQRDVMRRYFEQFGEILEAVVITDKNTGRSKGYGFVTFKDPNSAMRACENPTPVIDGRRANCNLAFLGASTNNRLMRPPPLPFGVTGRAQVNNAVISSAYRSPAPSTIATAYYPQPPHYALPYSVYGSYSPGYPQENLYPMSYYGAGGQQQQFTPYYPAATPSVGFYNNYQPYYTNYSQSTHFHSGLNLHYPQTVQYPYLPQQFASASTTPILSLPASIAAASVSGANAGSAMAPSSSRQQVKITSNQNISS